MKKRKTVSKKKKTSKELKYIKRTYSVKALLKSATGFVGKVYVGWTADATIEVTGSEETITTMNGDILASGKIDQIYDKKGKKVSIPYDKDFENKPATIENGALKIENDGPYATIVVSIEVGESGKIINANMNATIKGTWGALANNILMTGNGKQIGEDYEVEAPVEPPTEPPVEPPSGDYELTEEEAKELIKGMQFISGKKDNPNAIRLVRQYGRRITHFGGGNTLVSEDTLWKPAGDTSNNLVVILPSHIGAFSSLDVGSEVQKSMSIGNGYRPHLRYSKTGSAYPAGVLLNAHQAGSCNIAKPGSRQSFKLSGAVIEPPESPSNQLPQNPKTPNDLPGSISEQWSFSKKDYDKSYRIRFPTMFAKTVGTGSYSMVNGNKATFRSYDTDNGSKRPSYTISSSIKLTGPITCILYSKESKALAWFSTPDTGTRSGKLPNQASSTDPVTPNPPVTTSNPSYKPGFLEVPIEFTQHGAIKELRIARISIANKLLKSVAGSSVKYTCPLPGDPAWQEFANGASAFGTVAKFADGKRWDGYIKSNLISAAMPIYPLGKQKGPHFWVPV